MGKLSDEEAKALKELQAKADAPDAPDPEGEVWESPDGTFGAKLRGEHYTSWLRQKFPGLLAEDEQVESIEVSNKPGAADEGSGTVRAFGRTIRKTS